MLLCSAHLYREIIKIIVAILLAWTIWTSLFTPVVSKVLLSAELLIFGCFYKYSRLKKITTTLFPIYFVVVKMLPSYLHNFMHCTTATICSLSGTLVDWVV